MTHVFPIRRYDPPAIIATRFRTMSHLMRITHIISGLEPSSGGPVTAVTQLAIAQAHQPNTHVTLLATRHVSNPRIRHTALRAADVTVRVLGNCRPRQQLHPALGRFLRRWLSRTDIVHIHGLYEEIQHQAARIARHLRKPYIVSPHGMLSPWSLTQGGWKKKLYLHLRLRHDLNLAAGIHFTSQMEMQQAKPHTPENKGFVIPLGINLDEFRNLPAKGFLRERYSALREGPMVIFLGRVHPGKGVDLLIQALSRLANPLVKLAVVGPADPGYLNALQQLADEQHVKDRITFIGPLYGKDRIAALIDADLLALPSAHENFGIVVLEALAAGTPVVVSDQVGLSHEIKASGLGGVFSLTPEALTDCLNRWLQHERPSLQLLQTWVADHFDWRLLAKPTCFYHDLYHR